MIGEEKAEALKRLVEKRLLDFDQSDSDWNFEDVFNIPDEGIQIQVEPLVNPDAQQYVQKTLDGWDLSATVGIWPYVYNESGTASQFSPGKATGLDYIPYDGFRMTAHRGEMLLNAVEAQNWRSGATSGGATSADIGDAVRAAVSGLAVNMDGRSVGTMVAQTVSDEIQIKARRNRF